jgi:hypothetical protein
MESGLLIASHGFRVCAVGEMVENKSGCAQDPDRGCASHGQLDRSGEVR